MISISKSFNVETINNLYCITLICNIDNNGISKNQ